MRMFKYKVLLGIVGLLSASLSATINLNRQGAGGFAGEITGSTSSYVRYSGTMIIGTDGTGNGANTSDGTSALASVSRTATFFTPAATHPLVNNLRIQNVDHLATGGADFTHIICVSQTNTARITAVLASDLSATFAPAPAASDVLAAWPGSRILGDADGEASTGITHIVTTHTTHVFARTLDNAGGAQGDAIAMLSFGDSALTFSIIQGTTHLTATRLDRVTPATYASGGASTLMSYTVQDMHWSSTLERLYVASSSITGDSATSRAYSIVVGNISTGGLLQFATTGITTADPGSGASTQDTVIGVEGANQVVVANKVRTMFTSTGLHYLIVNGGVERGIASNGIDGATRRGDKVYGLRLGINGSQKGRVIQNDLLTETAIGANYDYADRTSAMIGGGGLSQDVIGATFDDGTRQILDPVLTVSDMFIIDDSVYISVVAAGPGRSRRDDPGIWRSQALFDDEGKIVSWTAWERAFSSRGASQIDNTPFFAIDGRTGHVIRGSGVEAGVSAAGKTVYRSQWKLPSQIPSNENSLQNQINRQLAEGCYCMYDIPIHSPGAGDSANMHNSIAIFGGFEKVVFARTKSALDNAVTNTATGFQNSTANFKVTGAGVDPVPGANQPSSIGLTEAGPIRVLGYSHTLNGSTSGYFFAGTNKGLFAYAASGGDGFDSRVPGSGGISDLESGIFDSTSPSRWHAVAEDILTPTTAVTNIITCSLDRIYFTTLDVISSGNIVDKLYEMPIPVNIGLATPRLVAQSGLGGFPANTAFTGCTILTTTMFDSYDANSGNDVAIGIMSTNNGIFTTTCDIRKLTMHANAAAATSNEWAEIVTTTGVPYQSITPIKDARLLNFYQFRNTHFYSTPFIDTTSLPGIYERSTFLEAGLNGGASMENGFAGGTTQPVKPVPVDVSEAIAIRRFYLNDDSSNFNNLEFSTNFYTDGGRRLFSRFDPTVSTTYSSLRSLPYTASEWNQTAAESDILANTFNRIHWIGMISGTGQLMAGTDTGVISLD